MVGESEVVKEDKFLKRLKDEQRREMIGVDIYRAATVCQAV